MIFFFLCLTDFTQYDALSVHPCCCKWPYFILFKGRVIFHCQKPSIYCLELDIFLRSFQTWLIYWLKIRFLGGLYLSPIYLKGSASEKALAPFRERGLSLVKHKASFPGVSCLFAWVLPCWVLLSGLAFPKGASICCVFCGLQGLVPCAPCIPHLLHLWAELLGWVWKLTCISLDLHEDSVASLLFMLTLLSLSSWNIYGHK